VQQGIALATITASNLSLLRVTPARRGTRENHHDVQNGLAVIVPTRALTLNASPITSWFTFNPTTGEMLARSPERPESVEFEFGYLLKGISFSLL